MAAALARKQGRRKAVRKELDFNLKECRGALDDPSCTRVVMIGMKTNLEKTIEQLNEIDDEMLNVLDPEEVEEDMTESKVVLRPTYEVIAGLTVKLEKLSLVESASSVLIAPNSSSSVTVNCKLPELQLPTFKGQALKWRGFWDQFEVAIHLNDSLSEINKFNYLKRFLSGEALASISGLALSSDNYKEAVDILKRRYGNPNVLITAYMESLLKLNKVKAKDFLSLRKFFDEVENCLRSLRSLKVETSTYGSLLLPLLKDKLPEEFVLQIGRRFGTETWTLDLFMNYFEAELTTAENCFSSLLKGSENIQKERGGIYTTSSFYGQVDNRPRGTKPFCVFCNKGHTSSQCRNVSNVRARKDILRRSARCFICLEKGHRAIDCTVEYACRICEQRHNISICENKGERKENNERSFVARSNGNYAKRENNERSFVANGNERQKKFENESKDVFTNISSSNIPCILLQTATGEVSDVYGDGSLFSKILFDSGSQRSYVTEELAKRLNLKVIRTEKLVIKTFGKSDESELRSLNVVKIKIRNRSQRGIHKFVEVLCVPTLCSPLSNQRLPHSKKFAHLVSLDLADNFGASRTKDIDILIGCDFYHSFFTGRVIYKGNGCPTASESILGWILSGPIEGVVSNGGSHSMQSIVMRCEARESDDLQQRLNKFWEVENIGYGDTDVVQGFQKDTTFNGKRYVVKLPFKPDHELIPDNFQISKNRLRSLKKRLDGKGMTDNYGHIFEDYEKDGIVERVPDNEITSEVGKVHYLPHRPVVREDKETTKIRAVFDASCGNSGPSLNECLYSGPNMLAKIFDVLLRFRFNKVAILADIKQAFLNVEVSSEHRDFLRFLWFDSDSSEENIVIYRFLRVVFGVTSSPFLLNGTIKNHLEKYRESDKELVEVLEKDFYVDDLVSGTNSVDQGKLFIDRVLKIMAEAGFELRKWVTNDSALREFIKVLNDDVIEKSAECKSEMPRLNDCKQVLGLDWDVLKDEFVYTFEKFLTKCDDMKLTKRNILSVAASFYDPLGFISPVTARIKVLFQLLCKNKLEWDEELSDDLKEVWCELLNVLKGLNKVSLTRYALDDTIPLRIELHGFCDSSLELYCGVVYLRIVSVNSVSMNFLCAKTRVSPLKLLSIPRLELLGCLLLTTLLNECQLAMKGRVKIDEIYCWSDSEVSLLWIKGKEKQWKPWVENRVIKIREVVNRDCWFHVPGKLNPADGPTRRCKDFNDLFSGNWFKGPDFLRDLSFQMLPFSAQSKSKSDLSSQFDTVSANSLNEYIDFNEEVKPVEHCCSVSGLCDIINIERFSSLKKLVMTLAYIRRFIHNLKVKKKEDMMKTDVITAEEYEQSLLTLVRHEQCELQKQSHYNKLKSSLKLFVDNDGLIRTRGRFGESTLTFQQQCPIILRSCVDSYFTRLLILDAHEKVYHNGIESTLTRIRQRFWLCKGRKSVKDVLRPCVTCKRFQGRVLLPPLSPDLPYYRVQYLMNPFNTTGLDFAGPLYVKSLKDSLKVYILILTCACSRAIHIELVPNLTTPSFINAFKRFASRRGYPSIVVHDNAKTFKAAETKRFFTTHSITSKPILPLAPWWGGMYERLVRSVKLPLLKVVGKALLTFDELRTLLCEIEMVINSRPLVYTSEDDLHEPLTPFHIMYGRDISRSEHLDTVSVATCLDYVNRYKYMKTILSHYWNRFSTSYLNELRQHHAYRKEKISAKIHLHEGDVVLIKDDNPQPRNNWKKGIIDKIVYGRDNQPRGVKLYTISKTGQRSSCHRPLQKIIPFEIANKCRDQIAETDTDNDPECEGDQSEIFKLDKGATESRRSTRKAAAQGQELRRLQEMYY